LNEPWIVAVSGHLMGDHAPGIKDRKVAAQVAHNLLIAHGLSTIAIRAVDPELQVGIALNTMPPEPYSDSEADLSMANLKWQMDLASIFDPLFKAAYPADIYVLLGADIPEVKPGDMALIAQKLDFVGINYYTRQVYSSKGHVHPVPGSDYSEMGWEVHPPALGRLLVRLNHQYHLPPIYITENGVALDDKLTDGHVHDIKRIKYLHDHLVEIRQAMKLGVNVRGYFLWSLMDNLEWAFGYDKRFGIVYVDEDCKRIVKDSGFWYEKVVRSNEVHR